MSAREAILGKIRKSLAASDDVARIATVSDRLQKSPRGVMPARANPRFA